MFSNKSDLKLSIEFELSDNATESLSEFELNDTMIYNSTDNDNSTYSLFDEKYLFYGYPFVVPMALLMVVIIVLAVGGNVMVILTIVRHRGMRTRTNMFIVNLAVADILVAVLDMPVSLTTIIEGGWVFGDALCKLNGFTMALFLISSIHTLMYISVHKYISITRPFSRAMTPKRIKMMILASWLWAAFCATGPLVGWNKNVYKKGASQCGPGIPDGGIVTLSHSIVITTSNYLIPLGIMTFCYWKIFREIHVHMTRIRKTSNIDLENSVAQQKKVATTLFLVLACFLLCWTPFIIYSNLAVLLKNKKSLPPILNPLAYWCGYLNSACNPIIYAFRSPSFRKGYKEIMCGAQSAKLSQVNSMSFRSRSQRGSLKSGSLGAIQKIQEAEPPPKADIRRQRTLLAQTSWISMPMIPYFSRSFSSKQRSSNTEVPDNSPSPDTGCGICGFWKPRPLSTVIRTEDVSDSRQNKRHSSTCPEIKEEDEEVEIEPLNSGQVCDNQEEEDTV